MSNGAFPFHAHKQCILGNLVRVLYDKNDSSETTNYNLDILFSGDVHIHQFSIETKKQKINNFVALRSTI